MRTGDRRTRSRSPRASFERSDCQMDTRSSSDIRCAPATSRCATMVYEGSILSSARCASAGVQPELPDESMGRRSVDLSRLADLCNEDFVENARPADAQRDVLRAYRRLPAAL